MKGLELSRKYYETLGVPMLKSQFGSYYDRIAAGLVGEGSECFGFDDEISRDHDWGPSFSLWLCKEDYDIIGAELQNAYNKLPAEFSGFSARTETELSGKRVGVHSIGDFYKKYIGLERSPITIDEWRRIPEHLLAVATNGEVFYDPLGKFSEIRQKLLDYYPEDLRIKKIVARAAVMSQSGQYNYQRSLRRQEFVAAQLALDEFVRNGISMVFLLNKKYAPYYKWMHRGLRDLPILSDTYVLFNIICLPANTEKIAIREFFNLKYEAVEEICRLVAEELKHQELTDIEGDNFLQNHCTSMTERIKDPKLKKMHFMSE